MVSNDPVEKIRALLGGGATPVALQGARGGALALILAQLAHRSVAEGPVVVVTDQEESARALASDLQFFLGDREEGTPAGAAVIQMPVPPASPYVEISADRAGMLRRMAALARLLEPPRGPLVVCLAASALCRKVVPARLLREHTLSIRVGGELDRDRFAAALATAGYDRFPVVDDPATYALRGAIIDLFPPLQRYPIRIELWGDEVESIRLFDPATQRTLRPIDEASLHPVTEVLHDAAVSPRQRLLELADELHYPTRAVRALLDEIADGRPVLGRETLAPAFVGELDPLWSYLSSEGPWIVVDPEAVATAFDEEKQRASRLYEAGIAAGRLLYPVGSFYVEPHLLKQQLETRPMIHVPLTQQATAKSVVVAETGDNARLVAQLKRARSDRGDAIVGTLADELRSATQQGRSALIVAGDAHHAGKLEALLGLHDVAIRRDLPDELLDLLAHPAGGEVFLRQGELSRGFQLSGWLVISHDEIFGPKTTRPIAPRARLGKRLGDLRDLRPGDHLVHGDHGLGRYVGLVNLDVAGVRQDFLLLEYAAGDKLYLPVHRMSQVHRYLGGGDGGGPRLDRLGGTTWQRRKRKVEVDVRRFSEELLQLYAQRAALAGHAFPQPDAEYTEFEERFAFTETADQLRAIEEVLGELTADRPMDRLICGDVGFGKTEVALRAAFLVAMSGRQVALLAPTTVLVEQHFRTFVARMRDYPLRVESVSRFRKAAELRAVRDDIAAGKVDVVVGTHRLLSADVRFADLGLLIIDEEQRFGVAHKERIKRMRTQVDVLALTATPIPRSLQLSMIGLREISVIATPPDDRLAIRTVVCRHDDLLVAEATRKELARGGQAFFVHNEVKTIDAWAKRLGEIVPEARIAIAHGQMDSRRLERVMLGFVDGQSDVLVCTTIIESGLDIPRANTMFVNRADRFGLSQLYQLRGRIGRSDRRAYCYLLVPPTREVSGEARQRLELLQQFTQLGSGFSIASYDLELRGAGDLLGARQSGHVAAVGFEAYARILEEAVADLKGEPIVHEADPELSTRVAAFIPDDYVEEVGQRLELYQRLSDACRDEPAIQGVLEEMHDRYGPPPQEVEDLCALMVVKGLAVQLRVQVLELTESRLALTLDERTPLSPTRVAELVSNPSSGFRFSSTARLVKTLSPQQCDSPLRAAQQTLRGLLAM